MPLLLLSCAGSQTIVTTSEDEDTGAPTDTAPVADDSADALPGPSTLGEVSMSPEGGAFVDSVEVTLTVDGAGSAEWCLADPGDRDCTMQAYTGPFSVSRSAVVYAQATLDGDTTDAIARSFVEVESGLADFSSTVPVLLFWTDGQAPDSTSDVALGLTVIEPPAGGELTLLDTPTDSGRARLHIRGSSSAGFDKSAFDMELWEAGANLDRREPLLGMPENGDWILYAPYYFDDALVRNPLAMAMSNAIGRYAPRTRFAEVFIGERGRAVSEDDYIGVYVVMEEIEVDPERVAITPLLPEDVADPEVSGGYLFKVDRTGEGESGFYAGTAGGQFSFQQTFVAVEPTEDELVRAQSTYLADRVDEIGWAVAGMDGLASLETTMDVDSFIDHHIINVVMKNPDAFRLSGYMHQDRQGLLAAGPVWDFDRTAGSPNDSRALDPRWWDNSNETSDCTFVFEFAWYAGLFDDPEFSQRYWARFESLLNNELSIDAIDAMLDGFAEGLSEPAARNQARWGVADYDSEQARLRDWLHTRHAWMTACIQTYSDPRECLGR